jgi:hypothetical protein
MKVPNRQGEFFSIGSGPIEGIPENMVIYGNVSVDGLKIAYRECGVSMAPKWPLGGSALLATTFRIPWLLTVGFVGDRSSESSTIRYLQSPKASGSTKLGHRIRTIGQAAR